MNARFLTRPPEPEDEGAAGPPNFDPREWEDFAGFRETFLAYSTFPETTLSCAARGILFDMALAASAKWPDQRKGGSGANSAAVADRGTWSASRTLAVTPSSVPTRLLSSARQR